MEEKTLVAIIGCTMVLVLMMIRVPIAVCLGAVGVGGFAWMVGWALVLEYAIAASAVSVGWSGYFTGTILNEFFGLQLPAWLSAGPLALGGAEGGFIGGGQSNTVASVATNAVVVGGSENRASNSFATVGGGRSNNAASTFAVISGGLSAGEVVAATSIAELKAMNAE